MPRKSMLFFLIVLLLSAVGVNRAIATDKYEDEMRTFSRIMYEVMGNYVNEVDAKKLFDGAYRGMLQQLDPYSQYFDEREATTFAADTEGEFGGVGIEISLQDGLLTVVTPIKGTPAYDAGVLPGDLIMRIDGKTTERITLEEAVRTLRGPVGSTVVLTVRHVGATADTKVTITRAIIKPAAVEAEMLDEAAGIGYMRVSSFSMPVISDIMRSLDQLQEKRPLRGLILDLRQNPGGLLDKAVEMSDLFLAEGPIVSVRGRHREMLKSYKARKGQPLEDTPLVLLVDEGSASASEIVAAALKDHNRAMLVGARTFGKGSVQNVIPLGKGEALKLTTAKYYTPNDKPIEDRQGIMPDIYVPMNREMLIALRTQEREDKMRGNHSLRHLIEADDQNVVLPGAQAPDAPAPGDAVPANGGPDRRARVVDFQLKAAMNILKWQLSNGATRTAAK